MVTGIGIRAVLIDLSGTIHIEDKPIPGAIEAIKRLRKLTGVELKFVTNTTKESLDYLHKRLTGIGFDIKKDEIFTSLTAARRLIDENRLRPMLLLEDEALDEFAGKVMRTLLSPLSQVLCTIFHKWP